MGDSLKATVTSYWLKQREEPSFHAYVSTKRGAKPVCGGDSRIAELVDMDVQPYWNALMNFQSRPALSLGSSGLESADAVTDFDHSGSGLVALEFEGEVRQLLATLDTAEQQRGLRVRRGDKLHIESIDEERNRCTVSSVV